MNEKVSIYVVVSKSKTWLSCLIGFVTRTPYTHVSIALDEELGEMYSFGRVNPYNPVWGGFVMESPEFGTFKRFKDTKVKLLRIEITKKQYDKLEKILKDMYANRHKYHYNYIGLATACFEIPWKQNRCYYCSEFVRDVLVETSIMKEEDFKPVVKPNDFAMLDIGTQVYEGSLQEYSNP